MKDTSHTVLELVTLAKQGDRFARGELFLRYRTMVLSTTYKWMHNYGDAQELVQDVFLQAFRKLDQLHEPQYFGNWIRSITVRMCLNWRICDARRRTAATFGANIAENQRTRRNNLPVSFDTVVCGRTDAPDERMLQQERADYLHDAISRLCEMDRDALTARYFHYCSYVEMSVQFDVPLGTIKRRLHVARKRLTMELEEA